ncbi:hypothetical protein [Aliarcobacter lanthieri]|uniref:hypothetical protein n=1 Tax=Aliarcobacter lanthieri TaxID=1355374 RepID=UPI000479AECF|nr:hypothetical protein [Aliarcobacter lanthieri]
MKTQEEDKQYVDLKADLIAFSDAKGVKWAGYFSTLLGIGGTHPEQTFRNFFNDTNKRFNNVQLAILYNELRGYKNIEIFNEDSFKQDILKATAQMGKIIEKMNKHFDGDNEIALNEILPIVPEVRELYGQAKLLYLRVEETKANL